MQFAINDYRPSFNVNSFNYSIVLASLNGGRMKIDELVRILILSQQTRLKRGECLRLQNEDLIVIQNCNGKMAGLLKNNITKVFFKF